MFVEHPTIENILKLLTSSITTLYINVNSLHNFYISIHTVQIAEQISYFIMIIITNTQTKTFCSTGGTSTGAHGYKIICVHFIHIFHFILKLMSHKKSI